jgi:hypothetical protein
MKTPNSSLVSTSVQCQLRRRWAGLGLAAVLLAAPFGVANRSAAAEQNAPAPDTSPRGMLRQALSLSQQPFSRELGMSRTERFATFRQLLTSLAASGGEVRDATAEEQTLLEVLQSAGTRPELLDELLAHYGHSQGPEGSVRPRVLRPLQLDPRHLAEAYRPAWEALLLAPPNEEIEFMQRRFTITKALAKIGNLRSVPVLELAFASTCAPPAFAGENRAALERQFRVLECLNRFATAESLHAMLRCLARAESTTTEPPPKVAGYDLRQWIVRFLTDQDNYNTGEKWRKVLETYPKNTLPAKQRELLDEAAAFKLPAPK